MNESLSIFPRWKKDATPAERFSELEGVALKHPERFSRIALVYQEILPDKREVVRQISVGCTTNEVLGLLEQGKIQVMKDAGGV